MIFHHSIFQRGHIFSSLILLLVGLFMIGVMNVLVKKLGVDYTGSFLVFMRNFCALFPSVIFLWAGGYFKKKKQHLKISRPIFGFMRGGIIVTAQLSFFTALQIIELATARAISYSSALFVTLLAMVLLREKCGIWRMAAVAFGLLGTFMVMNEGISLHQEKLFYYFLPLISAFFYALSLVTLQFFSRDDHHLIVVSYTQLVTSIVSALVISLFFEWQPILQWQDLFLMLLMGFTGSLGVLCISFAYRFFEASMIAPFHYFGLIYSLGFGWLFFAENPLSQLFPGVLLIVGAGVLTLWRESRKNTKRRRDADSSR